jgi:hypothetical protein
MLRLLERLEALLPQLAPEAGIPPNGPASLSVSGSLIQTVPARISRMQRTAVSRSRVYTFAPSPKRVPFASRIASPSESTGTIGATGPKVSSRSSSVDSGAPVTTAGE